MNKSLINTILGIEQPKRIIIHQKRKPPKRAIAVNNGDCTISLVSVYKKYGGVCAICGRKVKKSVEFNDPESPVVDHIIPISKDGTHTWDNVQLAHWKCNAIKGVLIDKEEINRRICLSCNI